MRFEAFVALRYLRGKRKNFFISLITLISVAGVSVGVIALIVVMSVMTGFGNELRATIIGNRSHLEVTSFSGEPLTNYEKVITEIEALCPEIVASGPFIQIEALIESAAAQRITSSTSGAFVIGVDPARESLVTDLATNLTTEGGRSFGAGSLPEKKEIVLAYGLANRLGVRIGEKVKVITLKNKPGVLAMTRSQKLFLEVSGISHAKMSEFDMLYSWVNLETARMLTGVDGVDGVHCKIDDPFKAEVYSERISRGLGYSTQTWRESQASFFAALKQEKLVMFIILVFIVLVAAFNITSTLIMMVMEKRRDIGILRTIGSSGGSILKLFMIEGLLIGLTGTFIGVLCGTLLAYNLNPVAEFIAGIFNINLFDSQIYYFDKIPVDVVPLDVLWITIASIILSFLSTLYPAWSASRLDPVEALRYE